MQNAVMPSTTPVNACRLCGATAYRPVIARDASGAMKPTGRYRCVGCKLEFEHVKQWRTPALSQLTFDTGSQGMDDL